MRRGFEYNGDMSMESNIHGWISCSLHSLERADDGHSCICPSKRKTYSAFDLRDQRVRIRTRKRQSQENKVNRLPQNLGMFQECERVRGKWQSELI